MSVFLNGPQAPKMYAGLSNTKERLKTFVGRNVEGDFDRQLLGTKILLLILSACGDITTWYNVHSTKMLTNFSVTSCKPARRRFMFNFGTSDPVGTHYNVLFL